MNYSQACVKKIMNIIMIETGKWSLPTYIPKLPSFYSCDDHKGCPTYHELNFKKRKKINMLFDPLLCSVYGTPSLHSFFSDQHDFMLMELLQLVDLCAAFVLISNKVNFD